MVPAEGSAGRACALSQFDSRISALLLSIGWQIVKNPLETYGCAGFPMGQVETVLRAY